MIKPHILIQAETNPLLMNQIVKDVGPRILEVIEAYSTQSLNRYNLRPGRIFGKVRGDERYRILDVTSNSIVYKDLQSDRIEYKPVDELLEKWNLEGFVEISPIENILRKIKDWLTPFLGGVLVAALVSWLMKKLGR